MTDEFVFTTDEDPAFQKVVLVNCDGLCEPRNPGGYGCYGWVARRQGKVIQQARGCIGRDPTMTNNRAEYAALLSALHWLHRHRERLWQLELSVHIFTDSQLVVNQVNGDWQVKADTLRSLVAEARELIEEIRGGGIIGIIPTIRLRWVPREKNEVADALSREAYRAVLAQEKAVC